RAVDWEADVINFFRNHPEQKEIVAERDTPTGRFLYLSHPINADPPCLVCHSTPDMAPRPLIATYGSANGFGWKPNEVIAAQIVSVPMAVPVKNADQAFRSLLIYLVGSFFLSVAVIDAALYFIVIRPLGKLSKAANLISQGNLDLPELSVKGK